MAVASKRPERPERPKGPGRRVQPMGLSERLNTIALGLGAIGSLALVGDLGYAVFGLHGAEILVALIAMALGAAAYGRFHRPVSRDAEGALELRSRRDRRVAFRLGRTVGDTSEPDLASPGEDTQRPRRLRRHGRHSQLRAGPTSRTSHPGS